MDKNQEDRMLTSATQWQKRLPKTWRKVGDETTRFLQWRQRDLLKNAALVDVWESTVPPGLKARCRLDRRTGNTLTIQVAPGAYMHQLHMIQNELLDELHRRCPRAGVQKLRLIPLHDEHEES